jgi:hypothetical protein
VKRISLAKPRHPSPNPSPQGGGGRYWIAVVPKSRVRLCVAGSFAMFAHGKHEAVMRVKPGDWLAYYSPRTVLKDGDEVRAFTAIGKIGEREPYQAEMAEGRTGWRRDIAYEKKALDAGIYPLLDELSFIKDRQHWGIFFHRSLFSVTRDDFALIASAMGLDPRRF